MAVNCVRPSETKEKKYHHNVAITAMFDIIDGRLYFAAKTAQAEVKGTGMLMQTGLVVSVLCHTK